MANFPGPAFGRAFTAASTAKTNKAALAENKRQAFAESLKSDEDNTIAKIAEIREAAGEIITRGGSAEQLEPAKDVIFALAKSFGDRLDQISAFAEQAGRGSEFPMGAGDSFIQSQIQLFETSIEAARLATPAATGVQAADEKLAEAQRVAEELGVPVDRVAKALGILPGDKSPIAGIGPSGETGFFREGPAGFEQVPGAQPIPSGLDIEVTPDGGVRVTTGTRKSALQKTTRTRLEKNVLDSREGFARLSEIRNSFNPAFLTFGGKLENFRTGTLEKINPDLLSDEERQFLVAYSTFTTNAIDNINRYIKEITGAQMSEPEADRLRKGAPDPERDGPTVFKAKMEVVMRQLALARARATHALKNGLKVSDIEFSQMETIIESRVDQLTSRFAQEGMTGQEAREKAREQVAQEFGI